jgi:ABC-type dipeptide/oligopeptide/nickel transport system permease component
MMARLARRFVWSVATLLGTAFFTFFLINAVPGDVARVIAGAKASPDVIKEIHAKYHLDDPLWQRFLLYLGQLAHGDLGHSYVTDQSVAHAILIRLPTTAALTGLAVVMWIALAVPLGVLTARFRESWFDRVTLVIATITMSLPAFWLARMTQYWLAYKLGWFSTGFFRQFSDLLLPAASLAILSVGYYARLVHTNMVEVLQSHYVQAASAKGASEMRVLFRHGLRNAMIPVVTILGMDVAGMLGGVIFTENVFALPGIGTLAVQSVFNLDPPMIMGTVMFSAVAVVGANWVVDLLYGWIDPRIKSAD